MTVQPANERRPCHERQEKRRRHPRPAGTTLKQVPAQVTSGPGWTWNATTKTAVVTADGTVVSGLSVSGTLQINADNVTVKNVKVTTGGNFGISLTHTAGVTIANSTISGQNATTGRVSYAIDDVYGDSTGTTIKANNISDFRTAVQISTGLADGNYIHDPGAASGSPTSGIVITGNRFGQNYYPQSGQYGPVAYFNPTGTGNTWTGNIWDTTAKTVPSS